MGPVPALFQLRKYLALTVHVLRARGHSRLRMNELCFKCRCSPAHHDMDHLSLPQKLSRPIVTRFRNGRSEPHHCKAHLAFMPVRNGFNML